MKFFLDTANLNEIREGVSLGLVDGVTTNPSLVAKEGGVDFNQHVAAISWQLSFWPVEEIGFARTT